MEEQAEGGPEVRAWPRCERLVVVAGTSGRRRCGCGDVAARVARCDRPCPCGPLRPAKTRHSPRQPCGAARGAGRGGRGRGFRPRGGCGAAPGVRGRAPRAPRAKGARREGSGELGAPEQVALSRERRPSARTHSAPRSVRASRLEAASVPPSLGFLIGEGVSHLCDTYRLGFLWELKRCRLSARGLLQLSRLALPQPGTPRPQVPRLWWWEVR